MTQNNTALVTSLALLDEALSIAKKHGASQLKIGDIEVVFGLPQEVQKADRMLVNDEQTLALENLAAEEYFNLQNL